MKPSQKKSKWVLCWAKFGPNYVHCCENSKETGIINRFFHILHREYLLKEKLVAVETPEWKFKATIARNVTFEQH